MQCKPCNASHALRNSTNFGPCVLLACLPCLRKQIHLFAVSCLPFKLRFFLLLWLAASCEALAVRTLQEKPSVRLLALVWRRTAAGSRCLKLSLSIAVPCQSQKHRFLQQHPPQLAHLASPGSSPSRRETLRSLRSPTERQHRVLTGRRSTTSE